MSARVSFDGKFTTLSDIAAERRAGDTRLPILMRVELACVQRMNNFGHAPFDKDELAQIVHRGVPQLTERQIRTVRDNVRKLVQVGLAAPESTTSCVVLDNDTYQRPRGKGGFADHCLVLSHKKLRRATWTLAAGWEPRTPATLESPAPLAMQPAALVPMVTAPAVPAISYEDFSAEINSRSAEPRRHDPWAEDGECDCPECTATGAATVAEPWVPSWTQPETVAAAGECDHRFAGIPPACRLCGLVPAAA